MKWVRVGNLIWRADPYLIDAAERIRDHQWTGEFTFAAYLLAFERYGSIVGREPIGPPARTIEAAQSQCEKHAAKRKGVA